MELKTSGVTYRQTIVAQEHLYVSFIVNVEKQFFHIASIHLCALERFELTDNLVDSILML